jgi:hypothetical protein
MRVVILAKAGIQFLVALVPLLASAQGATFTTKSLTPETALKAAQAALAKCRADGYQVTVAVVDRSGITQALLRDRWILVTVVGYVAIVTWLLLRGSA